MVKTLIASSAKGLPTPGIILPSTIVPLIDSFVLSPYGWCDISKVSSYLSVTTLIIGYAYIPTLATKAVFLSGLIANPKGCLPTGIDAVIFLIFKSYLTHPKLPLSKANNS
jgi:hypothetical protein